MSVEKDSIGLKYYLFIYSVLVVERAFAYCRYFVRQDLITNYYQRN